ncbi:hypothetical protein [Edwardsiella phage MSW-3]|uniref:Uncharacterized protein n=1 Tax=Edwardsiella phage MSW-3 TaxID=1264700 RepID=L0MXE7_9CAUD|nr:hypothetical protein G428_gp17 [Edwardsiella phage MSW-3]BAM68838.1 hypothetical protein [Edwardsiella phage MSW-3]
MVDTCNPVQDDVTIAYGENHDFNLLFKTSRDLSFATCTLTVRLNNSSDDVIHTEHAQIHNNNVVFSITPALCRTIGSGTFWYVIWMRDGENFEKPIVTGKLTIPMLTTRIQP